jgi:uncharacterized protein YecE (DUF72 family)
MDPRNAAKAYDFRIGCAGWTIPKQYAGLFPNFEHHLARYSKRFRAVEINSSFYRAHRRSTYERWAAAVPEDFAFSVKAPKEITHTLRMIEASAALEAFLAEIAGLGEKLGVVLFQLPPSFSFQAQIVGAFFAALRDRSDSSAACEARHPSWFTAPADDLLKKFRIARVAADPPVVDVGAEPGGWNGLSYFRLHGSPRMYYSEYSADQLDAWAERVRLAGKTGRPAWCIFDNTAAGAAIANALALQQRVFSA